MKILALPRAGHQSRRSRSLIYGFLPYLIGADCHVRVIATETGPLPLLRRTLEALAFRKFDLAWIEGETLPTGMSPLVPKRRVHMVDTECPPEMTPHGQQFEHPPCVDLPPVLPKRRNKIPRIGCLGARDKCAQIG
ncbi:MAG: hypothetical protein MI867_23265, partial [Pseudomonadales bacterium]|nr:hypothetical protein [Pseudomonadales bacterium]